MINEPPTHIAILGAGVIGLTTALTLSNAYPNAKLTIIATHFPGDRSISYASPWAGANWSSMATDNGPLENYDAVTYKRFGQLMDGESVHGCKVENVGEGNEAGLGRQGMWAVFDSPIEEAGILSEGTGKVWYDELVGGLRKLTRGEMPEEAEFGFEVPRTFRINTQIYLQWLQSQVLLIGAHLIRRQYTSLTQLLADVPSTSLLINCSGLGSLNLTDIRDTNLYPTRGQTLLIAEPKEPIERMYEADFMYLRSPKRVDPTVTYIFPRTHGGGVILGGSRDDNNWSEEWDEELGDEILHRATTLLPSLGSPSTLRSRIISRNVGLRPSRKGGPRIEKEVGRWRVPVVHCYGHAGAGFQSSWGTAERVLEIVQGLGKVRAKL